MCQGKFLSRLWIDNVLFQDKGQLLFEDKWPAMRPNILKLLQQEPVTHLEWQELFYSVHLVCLWDEKGPPKVKDALKDDIMEFIKEAQQVTNIILAVEHRSFVDIVCKNVNLRLLTCNSEFLALWVWQVTLDIRCAPRIFYWWKGADPEAMYKL